ncbi:hypothetical protein GCM10009087_52090 [Sphingomonas oligophenolica]|uniref:Uncharacterized protein n=1 Tax=Sphingomonas oligophenolica TaxID=301154 RepID=A0ABU9Y6W9_9SPHN
MAAISPNVSSGPYAADGSQTVFPFSFSIAAAGEVAVEVNGALASPASYTVAFGDTAGSVTFMAAPAAGAQIMLRSNPDYLQASDFENEGAYNLATVNQINRRAAIRDLVLKSGMDRSIRVPLGETGSTLPAAADRTGRVLGFGTDGTLIAVANDSAAVADDVARAEAAAAAAEDASSGVAGVAAAALADADRAELAAAAAALSAGIFANEAAGRAAVADGVRFTTVGSTSDKAVDIWQRVNSSSSTLLRSYPSLDALNAAIAALTAAYAAGRLSDDGFVGAREASVFPAAQAATVSGNSFTLPTSVVGIPVTLTGDQIGDTTTVFTATLQIVSGSAGTAFTLALARWYNASGVQIGSDVALTKTTTAITLTGTQPAGARSLYFYVVAPATTVCRFLTYQAGAPARPTTDAWYLSLLGAGVARNDPMPLAFTVADSAWSPLTGRVTVPATGGGLFAVTVPSGVNDGDVVWAFFDSPLEPTVWIQTVNARFGASGGGSGNHYSSQILHVGGNRFAVALFVQSAADGAFQGVRWTWNNTGAATYFENIKLYVGPKPPFVESVSNIVLKGVRDEIDSARIKPLITLADDSCAIASDQLQPQPHKELRKFFGVGTKFQMMATPGNTLAQSASTVGLLPIHVSVSGDVIPASTSPVQITTWDYDPITSNSPLNPDYDPYAYLCGVLGRLSAGSFTGNSPATLYFTPVTAPAWPIDVPAGSKLILRKSRKRKGGLTLFPISSVNGTGGGFASVTAFVDAVFAANDPATIAGFLGLTPSPYGTGASALTPFVGKSYYSRLFNPNIMSAATVAEAQSLFGWNWTGTEYADWLAGNIGIPGSMRFSGDGFHPFNDVAAYVVAKNLFISAPVTSYLENWA